MRRLLPSATKLIVTLLVLGIGFGAGALLTDVAKPGNPLRYPVPQEVVTPGDLKPGDTLTTRGTKCNTSDEPVTIQGSDSFYVRLDAHGIVPGSIGRTLTLAAHECLDRTFSRTLPEIEPGTWRLQGQDCVIPENKFCRSWYSEGFTVVTP